MCRANAVAWVYGIRAAAESIFHSEGEAMNAIELLTADHKKVKNLFEKGKDLEGGKLKVIFDKIKRELETHTHIEETIFYPAVKVLQALKNTVREALKEHNQVKT